MGQVMLDAAHKHLLLGMASEMGERLLKASLEHSNNGHEFEFLLSQAYRTLKIIPARRKEAQRAAAG